jgi:hypothetical protein
MLLDSVIFTEIDGVIPKDEARPTGNVASE